MIILKWLLCCKIREMVKACAKSWESEEPVHGKPPLGLYESFSFSSIKSWGNALNDLSVKLVKENPIHCFLFFLWFHFIMAVHPSLDLWNMVLCFSAIDDWTARQYTNQVPKVVIYYGYQAVTLAFHKILGSNSKKEK